MKFAYKVWHSELDKWDAKKRAGQQLGDDDIAAMHERLPELLSLNYEREPAFTAKVILMSPSMRGVLVVLETSAATEDEADASIAHCLARINGLDPDLCLVAEPLPGPDQPDSSRLRSVLDLLRTRGGTQARSRAQGSEQAEHVYLSLAGDLADEDAGLAFERPFRLDATASHIGVPHEYAKLTQRFGVMGRDWSVGMRSLAQNGHGRTIETFHLQLADQTKLDFHFDVTTFYRR